MEYASALLTIVFLLAALLSIYFGINVIRQDSKSNLNWAFLAVTISLTIWSFGLGMANSTKLYQEAVYWRRFSAIGWTTIFSLTLHFLLLISKKSKGEKFETYLLAMHLPALVNLYIFAISNLYAKSQYNLVRINSGWTNIAVNNFWDYFFYVSYVCYLILILSVVWMWQGEIKSLLKKKQAQRLFAAMLLSAFAGGFIDLFANSFLSNPLPQIASLFILLPTWVMYESIMHHNMLNIKSLENEPVLISSNQQKRVFNYFSISLFLAAFIAYMSEYFSTLPNSGGSVIEAFQKAFLLVFLAVALSIIQRLKNENFKSTLTTIFLIVSIPIMAFQFVVYPSSTAWIYPILIIISSLLFNKRILLVGSMVVAVITTLITWIFQPSTFVIVNEYEYFIRILSYVAAFALGSYINKVYLSRIKENEVQFEFQKMVSDISYQFVILNQSNFSDQVDYLLNKIGVFFKVDKVYLANLDIEENSVVYTNEWQKDKLYAIPLVDREVFLEKNFWLINHLIDNNLLYLKDIDKISKEKKEVLSQLLSEKVKTLIYIPVIVKDKIKAVIGIETVFEKRVWSKVEIEMLYILANILSSGIVQVLADEEIEFMAYYDSLTRLPNRFLFEDRVNQAINLSLRTAKMLAVVFIDLDNFKAVNDTIGHNGGDKLLVQVGDRLSEIVRKSDTVARFGGDEFMILLNNLSDPAKINVIIEKVMAEFKKPFAVSDQAFLVTASAGVAVYPVDGQDAASLIKNADTAMYKAKEKGNNRYALCTPEIKAEMQTNMELSNDLYRALENDEFVLYYQPQINLKTKTISGLEALIRWQHPSRGLISPGVFIPIAEKNGLINKIGDWVLKTACSQNKKWQEMGFAKIQVAVNLSAVQIIDPNIATIIKKTISESGLDPKYVELEITESIAIKETSFVLSVLNKLKEIGVSIAIDDFGTEYSSLSRLRDLPIDRIKIDMQFIQGIESNKKDKAITMVIINLAKNLDLNVLAEGVETLNQLDYLSEQLCDYVQGFYYYKPMPVAEIEKILACQKLTNSDI